MVEDNPQVLKLMEALVKSLGYRVVVATSGDEAWKLLEEHPSIDLVLTDVMLPGRINGPDLAAFARCRYPKLKILFCSGYAESPMMHNGILEQGAELISKPFRLKQLASRMSALLDPDL